MELHTKTMPWEKVGGDKISKGYNEAESNLKEKIQMGKFTNKNLNDLNNYRWRNYIVYWTAFYAASFSNKDVGVNLVECGVADGISAYFSMYAFDERGTDFTMYLYDSWDEMREKDLMESENLKNSYELSLNMTRENLQNFKHSTVYCDGYIPDIFNDTDNPNSVSWLHIDLNSAIPTEATLELFYDRLNKGGIILFDDYGWSTHTETKKIVDGFFKEHNSGIHLPLPTGQSIYFKK